jgi:hypothetical protein
VAPRPGCSCERQVPQPGRAAWPAVGVPGHHRGRPPGSETGRIVDSVKQRQRVLGRDEALLALMLRARVVPLSVWARVNIALAVAIFLVALEGICRSCSSCSTGRGNQRRLPAGYRRHWLGGRPGYAAMVASMVLVWVALVAGRGWAWWRCWAAASWCRCAALSLTSRSASAPWAPPSAPMLFALAARAGWARATVMDRALPADRRYLNYKQCSATRRRPWLLRLGLVSGTANLRVGLVTVRVAAHQGGSAWARASQPTPPDGGHLADWCFSPRLRYNLRRGSRKPPRSLARDRPRTTAVVGRHRR